MNGILVGVFVTVNIANIKHWELIAGVSGGVAGLRGDGNTILRNCALDSSDMISHEWLHLLLWRLFILFIQCWMFSWTHHQALMLINFFFKRTWDVRNLWSSSLITSSNILWGCSTLHLKVDIRWEMEMRVTACVTGPVVLVCAAEPCNRF